MSLTTIDSVRTHPLRVSLRYSEWRGSLDWLLAAVTIVISSAITLAYVWLCCPLDLAPDEAHYWDWSRHLDWSYYSKGPLVAWLIRASCEIVGPLSLEMTGSLAAAVRLPALFCHIATMTAWYILASGIFRSSRLGLMVLVLAAALPVVRIGAVIMTIDPPFLACWSWALVCVWRALDTGHLPWWIGAAIACALGLLAKYTMVLFPAAVVGYLFVDRRGEFRRMGIWLVLMGTVLGWLPIVAWNATHQWVTFRHVFGQVGTGGGSGIRWLGPMHFLGGQLGMMFGLWLVAFLASAWRFRPRREADPGIRLLWWCAVPVWLLFPVASLVKSGQPNWPAPAYTAGFILAVAWLREQLARPRCRLVGWCFGLNLVAGGLVVVGIHFPAPFQPLLARIAGPPTGRDPAPIRKLDITARLLGWKTLAAEVDRLRGRIASETGQEPVIAGTYWTIPGHLAFSCTGHPDVYAVGIPNHSDRHSQYDFWRPNPVADAQAFVNRTFLIVGNLDPRMLAAFSRVECPRRVVHTEKGIPMEVWAVWICHGFHGFDDCAVHEPGY